jgi:hypothetical protein
MSHKLSEIFVNLGGHPVKITGGTVEFTDAAVNTGATVDTLAGALWVEDRRNGGVFSELKHEIEVNGVTYIATYGVNAEKTLTEKGTEPKNVEIGDAIEEHPVTIHNNEDAPEIVAFTEDTLEVLEPGNTEPTTFIEADVVEKPKGKAKK